MNLVNLSEDRKLKIHTWTLQLSTAFGKRTMGPKTFIPLLSVNPEAEYPSTINCVVSSFCKKCVKRRLLMKYFFVIFIIKFSWDYFSVRRLDIIHLLSLRQLIRCSSVFIIKIDNYTVMPHLTTINLCKYDLGWRKIQYNNSKLNSSQLVGNA